MSIDIYLEVDAEREGGVGERNDEVADGRHSRQVLRLVLVLGRVALAGARALAVRLVVVVVVLAGPALDGALARVPALIDTCGEASRVN